MPGYVAMLFLGLLAYIRSAVPLLGPAQADDPKGVAPENLEALNIEPVEESAPATPAAAAGFAPLAALEFFDPYTADNVVPFPHRLVDSPALHFAVADPPARQEHRSETGAVQPGVTAATTTASPNGGGGAAPPAAAGEADEPVGPKDPDDRNRKPVSPGQVRLNEAFAGTAVMIGLSELLVHASDPDGDALMIRNVSVSSGSIGTVAGGFVFSSNAAAEASVVALHYEIFDGQTAVPRIAYIPLLRNPSIPGSDGDDLLVGTLGVDHVDALGGNDRVSAGSGDDVIFGGSGDDHIVAGAGRDIVLAGDGDDIVFAGAGDDLVAGGNGNDSLYGEDGIDALHGEAGDDRLSGGSGNDWLSGGEGQDRLDGEAGDDRLEGGDGDDVLVDGAGSDIVLGDAGDDIVFATLDGEADIFEGAVGTDTFDLSAAELGVAIDLIAGTAIGSENGADRIAGFEIIRGGAGDDTFTDAMGSERISAGDGDDVVRAAADASDDGFAGGDGDDTLDYSATAAGLELDISNGTISGIEIGEDSISGFETFVGGSGDDVFKVGQASVKLTGGEGADLFCFELPMADADAPQLIHDILDFVAGDRVLVADYEFTFSRREEYEDRFSHYYRDRDEADEELELRIHHRTENGRDLTIFDFDYDGDLDLEMSVVLYGHHQPLIYDTAAA